MSDYMEGYRDGQERNEPEPGPYVAPDELAADLDTQFHLAGLAIAMAAALLTGEEAAETMLVLMADWPETVPDHAATIGYRVAMILAASHQLSPEDLGTVAATILQANTQEADNNE